MQTLDLTQFDAIAFDVEGTLADTIPTHHASRFAAFKQHGYGHITREQHELGPTYGSSYSDIAGGILHAAGVIDTTIPFSENPQVQQVVAAHKATFKELAAAGFDAMPGALDFIKTVAPHFAERLFLVTSSAEQFVLSFIERHKLSRYFPEAHIIGEETTLAAGLAGKPSPDPYLFAKKRFNSRNLLVFEDTVPGVTSAKQAGAVVVALGFDTHSAALLTSGTLAHPPDVFVRDYNEAKKILGLSERA